ncbi:hypothetical protein FS842_001160 [Serendipita sp. 407]|nr:hypothetical protein FS842_001160 [Serendipita sp. 407]
MNNGGNNGGLMGPVNTTNPPPGAGMPEAYIVAAFDGPQGGRFLTNNVFASHQDVFWTQIGGVSALYLTKVRPPARLLAIMQPFATTLDSV